MDSASYRSHIKIPCPQNFPFTMHKMIHSNFRLKSYVKRATLSYHKYSSLQHFIRSSIVTRSLKHRYSRILNQYSLIQGLKYNSFSLLLLDSVKFRETDPIAIANLNLAKDSHKPSQASLRTNNNNLFIHTWHL